MLTIDLKKDTKDLYSATSKVKEVDAREASFLAVDGEGAPGDEAFSDAIQAVYSVVYTLKFGLKYAGVLDFPVLKLEVLYLDDPAVVPDISQWHWRVLMRVPDEVTGDQVREAQDQVFTKRGIDASGVSLVRWTEGRALQTMHVGPYDTVGETYARLGAYATEHAIELKAPAHEIYISDPRRTAPERIKTIVRLGTTG